MIALIAALTGIHESVLAHVRPLSSFSIAQRMSWAAKRQTTRPEDRAYSLLGIFDIDMPLLYGERAKAFTRLQEEIMKTSSDHSILAWRSELDPWANAGHLLAPSPSFLQGCGRIVQTTPLQLQAFSLTNIGLQITLECPTSGLEDLATDERANVLLKCRDEDDFQNTLALELSPQRCSGEREICDHRTEGGEYSRILKVAWDQNQNLSSLRTIIPRDPRHFQTRGNHGLLPQLWLHLGYFNGGEVITAAPHALWNVRNLVFMPLGIYPGGPIKAEAGLSFRTSVEDGDHVLSLLFEYDRGELKLCVRRSRHGSRADGIDLEIYHDATHTMSTQALSRAARLRIVDANLSVEYHLRFERRFGSEVYIFDVHDVGEGNGRRSPDSSRSSVRHEL